MKALDALREECTCQVSQTAREEELVISKAISEAKRNFPILRYIDESEIYSTAWYKILTVFEESESALSISVKWERFVPERSIHETFTSSQMLTQIFFKSISPTHEVRLSFSDQSNDQISNSFITARFVEITSKRGRENDALVLVNGEKKFDINIGRIEKFYEYTDKVIVKLRDTEFEKSFEMEILK